MICSKFVCSLRRNQTHLRFLLELDIRNRVSRKSHEEVGLLFFVPVLALVATGKQRCLMARVWLGSNRNAINREGLLFAGSAPAWNDTGVFFMKTFRVVHSDDVYINLNNS